MVWAIRLSKAAEKQLARFPRHDVERIASGIDEMVADPFAGDARSLKGRRWAGRFRKRVGDYRIIFNLLVEQKVIEISQILRRSEQTYK